MGEFIDRVIGWLGAGRILKGGFLSPLCPSSVPCVLSVIAGMGASILFFTRLYLHHSLCSYKLTLEVLAIWILYFPRAFSDDDVPVQLSLNVHSCKTLPFHGRNGHF